MTATGASPHSPKESPKMQFVMTGFREATGFRIFAFEGIAADRTRTEFTVKTELAILGRYGIRLQELPLLCRALLERRAEGETGNALTYTEDDMRSFAAVAAAHAEAAQRRKPPRRPFGAQATRPGAVPPIGPAGFVR
jgi:hypothetical protein